jgi:hypothetical protein
MQQDYISGGGNRRRRCSDDEAIRDAAVSAATFSSLKQRC